MKKILIVLFLLFVNLFIDNLNAYSYNYFNYSYDSTCQAWRYWVYSFPELKDKQTYTTTKWLKTTVLVCNNWTVSIQNTTSSVSTDSVVISNSSVVTNNTSVTTSDSSCKAWKVGKYSYPALSNGQTYNTTNWNKNATLICNNWYVTIKSSSTIYTDVTSITKDDSCKSWVYWTLDYPYLKNWEIYSNFKNISGGELETVLICSNWYISVFNTYTYCDCWYKSYWKICKKVDNYRY